KRLYGQYEILSVGWWPSKKKTFSCQSPAFVLSLFSRRRSLPGVQVDQTRAVRGSPRRAVERPRRDADFTDLSGAQLPFGRVVTARPAAPAQGSARAWRAPGNGAASD